MKFRSWWFLGLWLTGGIVGLALLFPDWIAWDLAILGRGERAVYKNAATAPPDESASTQAISDAAPDDSGNFSAAPPVVLMEVSPSDHGADLEDVLGLSVDESDSAAWGEVLGSETGDSNDGRIGGFGMIGVGQGGGGTGVGSAGYGSLGTVTKESGTAAAPTQSPTPRTAGPEMAPSNHMVVPESLPMAAESSDRTGASSTEAEPSGAGTSVAGAEFDSILDEIERKLASLPLGNVAFNTPAAIPFGESAAIELLVSLAETEEQLRAAVHAPGPVESASVHVSPYMEAQLSGVGFRIESATPARQLLSRSERTRWRWQIEPTKADELELTLTLSALIAVDGQERSRAIRTFEKTIVVDVPITHRVTQFIGNNQEWLGTVLIVPIVGAVYRMFRKRRRPTSPSGAEVERRAA